MVAVAVAVTLAAAAVAAVDDERELDYRELPGGLNP